MDTALEAAVAVVLEADLTKLQQRWYHTHRSERSPEGFPDYVIPVGRWLLLAELKRAGGTPTAAQAWWLRAVVGVDRLSLLVGGMAGAAQLVELVEGIRNGRRVEPSAVGRVLVLGEISAAGRVLVAGDGPPDAVDSAAGGQPRMPRRGRCRRRSPRGS